MHVPRGTKENVLKVNRTIDQLRGQLGRSPTPGELAAASELTLEEVVEAIEAATATKQVSLDALTTCDEDEPLPRWARGSDERLELVPDRDAVGRCVRALSERERQLLYLRFVEDLTQTEIGERIGLSQMQVSRLVRRALQRAREHVEPPTAQAAKESQGPFSQNDP